MAGLTLELDWPVDVLWPNESKGHHWARMDKARTQQKSDAFYTTREALGTVWPVITGNIEVTYTFCHKDRHAFDMDGALAAMKLATDGIAQGLGVDDRRFRPMHLLEGRPVGKRSVVLVTLVWSE